MPRSARQASLLVEATLIAGVNDGATHATQLAALLLPLAAVKGCRVKVNLIPYNRNDSLGALGRTFEPASDAAVRSFRDLVVDAGFFCTVRAQRGAEHAAACGMLATASSSRRGDKRHSAQLDPAPPTASPPIAIPPTAAPPTAALAAPPTAASPTAALAGPPTAGPPTSVTAAPPTPHGAGKRGDDGQVCTSVYGTVGRTR